MLYIYIYIFGHPPPPSTDPGIVFPICPGSEGGGRAPLQNSSSFQKSKNPKIPTQVSDFWKPRNLLKIQNSSRVSDFWKLEEFAQNPKFLEFPKIQKSKNPNPSFGFLETRAGASKSKKTQNSSSFQNSKNPKIPTPVSDFWELEEFAQNPKNPKFLEFPKIQKSKNPNPSFGFLETRGICSKSKESFQKSETGVGIFGFLDFWKLEDFGFFLDFEQIPRVSKNPGNSRNFGFFGF